MLTRELLLFISSIMQVELKEATRRELFFAKFLSTKLILQIKHHWIPSWKLLFNHKL